MASIQNPLSKIRQEPVPPPASKFQATDELLVKLSHVNDLKSIGDTVADYCAKALGSPAGMIFVTQDGDLQLLSQWPAKVMEKPLLKAMTRRGPIAHAFQT